MSYTTEIVSDDVGNVSDIVISDLVAHVTITSLKTFVKSSCNRDWESYGDKEEGGWGRG